MEDTTQRASQIGGGLTSRFRSQLSSFDNFSRGRNLSLQGTADAYRQNLIAQMGKTDSGKLMNEMIQGQVLEGGGASGMALAGLGLKGAKSFYGRRLARQQGEIEQARGDVDRAFPEEESGEVGEESVSETTPAVSQGVSSELPTATAEDFSGASSGISGVSEGGSIQVPRGYTQGDDPATAPSSSANLGEPGSTTELSDMSNLPTEGLGEPAPAGLQPPPATSSSLYTSEAQTGLSEGGYATRLANFSDQFSQAPQKVMFDNTADPPLSNRIDMMERGQEFGEGDVVAGEDESQAGTRLSNLMDTSTEQSSTVDFSGAGAQETEAISRGAQSIDYGAGPRAITQTELSRPQPTPQQPAEPTPAEPVATDSPLNPAGGVQESSSNAVVDANTHRSLVQDQSSQNIDEVKASVSGDDASAGANISGDVADTSANVSGMTAGQEAAAGGLEAGLEGAGETMGIMAGIETASSVLGVLAPLGMLAGLIYGGVTAQKQEEDQQKKMDEASAQEQGEINVEDNESQFSAGRPSFGSMSLAPNLDLKTSS